MTKDDLIRKVALRMDEITPDSGVSFAVDTSDNNPLYELIGGIVEDCALEVFAVAPYWRLPQVTFPDVKIEGITTDADSRMMLRFKVPEDFLRVAEIDCSAFKRPVTEVYPEQSPEGKRQHNRFLMGRETKPVGVMSHGVWAVSGTEGTEETITTTVLCREIDCYSIAAAEPSSVTISASYIAKPAIAGTGDISFPEALQPALEWLAAARAFGARGDANHASICQQNAQNLLV